jgi:hypothetical protein
MDVGCGVRRIEMTERETPVFGGAEFGTAGTYERLHRTVFGELDRTHLLNASIVNLAGPRATHAVTSSIRATFVS